MKCLFTKIKNDICSGVNAEYSLKRDVFKSLRWSLRLIETLNKMIKTR